MKTIANNIELIVLSGLIIMFLFSVLVVIITYRYDRTFKKEPERMKLSEEAEFFLSLDEHEKAIAN